MNRQLLHSMQAAGLVMLTLGCLPSITEAIPANQRDIDLTVFETNVAALAIVPNTSVTVNNGSSARQCIIQFSAEFSTEPGDNVRARPIVDSTNILNCTVAGPESVYTADTDRFETRTLNWVRQVGTGMHTVRACIVTDDANNNGTRRTFVAFRTLTVECRTQ